MGFVNQPAIISPITRTGKNIIKLGILAGLSIFTSNLFRTQATDTILRAKLDFDNIYGMVKSR